MKIKNCELMLILVVINTWKVSSRAASEQQQQQQQIEKEEPQEIQLHVITKREAMSDLQQDYPYVDGRTYRASEPLDPNGADLDDSVAPQNLFESFETESKLFQPEIESDDSRNNETDRDTSLQARQEDDSEKNETSTNSERKYGAQYPYSETTSHDEYNGTVLGSQQQGYQENDGVQQTVTSRRVVLAGRGSDSPNNRQYDTHTTRTQVEYRQPSQTSRSSSGYTTGRGDSSYTNQYGNRYPSNSRQTVTNRRVYTGSGANQQYNRYNTGTSGTTSQRSRTEVRGAPYNGPRYVDSNGHYVDAHGRHLDSTGRYYDVSGRYNDATMTSMQTYQHVYSGSNGGLPSSGTNSGYYNNNRRYTSGTSSSNGYYDSSGRFIPYQSGTYGNNQGGSYVDATDRSRPVNSYGGTQFYSGGSSYQTTYDPITSQISSDPTCTAMNVRVTINGLSCTNAVAQLGPYVCYNYERVSTECCERCLQVKISENTGCEYGDRSQQCRDINPYDCYNERNRQVCCDRCRIFREQRAQSSTVGCEYWDMTPRCEMIIQKPHLCYQPENQRVCCHTCPRLENRQEPDCRWGNQSPDMCRPYSADGKLRIDCYIREVQEICCASCKSLRQRIRENIPGCEYGDSPVLFYSGGEALDCPAYISQYGLDNCDDPEISRKCCYTCYRYRQARG